MNAKTLKAAALAAGLVAVSLPTAGCMQTEPMKAAPAPMQTRLITDNAGLIRTQ